MIPILLALACAKQPDAPMNFLTQPPAVAPTPDFTPVTPKVLTLSNGASLWYVHRPGLPLVSLNLVLPGGATRDPVSAIGTAYLSDAMILEGAGSRDASSFSAEMDRLAVEVAVSTWGVASVVSLDAHTGRFSEGLDLFADAVLRPSFQQEDLDRLKESALADIKESMDDPRQISAVVRDQVYYGDGHPLAPPIGGTTSGLNATTLDSLKASWAERYAPAKATFILVGDVAESDAIAALESRFGDWTGEGTQAPIRAPERPTTGPQLVFVDHPGTSQTSLRVVMPAPASGTDAAVPAQLGSIVLGGTFTSRLNQLLREEKGYTYGARARVSAWTTHGTLSASTSVQRDVSAPALKDLLGELTRYLEGIDEAELTKARSAKKTRAIEAMGSRSDIASVFAALAANNRPVSALNESLEQAQTAKVEDIHAAIQGSRLDQAVIVVVGDLEKIQTSIEEAVPGGWTTLPRPE